MIYFEKLISTTQSSKFQTDSSVNLAFCTTIKAQKDSFKQVGRIHPGRKTSSGISYLLSIAELLENAENGRHVNTGAVNRYFFPCLAYS